MNQRNVGLVLSLRSYLYPEPGGDSRAVLIAMAPSPEQAVKGRWRTLRPLRLRLAIGLQAAPLGAEEEPDGQEEPSSDQTYSDLIRAQLLAQVRIAPESDGGVALRPRRLHASGLGVDRSVRDQCDVQGDRTAHRGAILISPVSTSRLSTAIRTASGYSWFDGEKVLRLLRARSTLTIWCRCQRPIDSGVSSAGRI